MPYAPQLFIPGCHKMSLSESSLPVQYANWQEEVMLKRKLGDISNNEKQKLREIYTEQRMVIRKFHAKLWNSRLIQAKMSGDRGLEQALRTSKSTYTDVMDQVLVPSTQPQYRTPQLSACTSASALKSAARARGNTQSARKITHRNDVDVPHTSNIKLRPNTVATDSQTRLFQSRNQSDRVTQSRPWSEKGAGRSRKILDTAFTHRMTTGQLITQYTAEKVETTDHEQGSRNSDDEDSMSTTTSCSNGSRINLLLPNDPYAPKIRTFCKSLKYLNNDDSKIKTHHSDYYADIILHQKPESQSATSSQHTSKRSSSLSSDNYPVRPLPRAGKSLTFKSITVPAGLNSRHL